MSYQELTQIKNKLLEQRRDLLKRIQGLETEWQILAEPEIEPEEAAQKSDLTRLFNQLDRQEREEIEAIDHALIKIATTGYGVCEKCRKPVASKRLEALPATRFCKKCAELFTPES